MYKIPLLTKFVKEKKSPPLFRRQGHKIKTKNYFPLGKSAVQNGHFTALIGISSQQ